MNSDKIIGRNLKSYRERSGFSQEMIANYLKIQREQVSYYETGARETPFEVLTKLSDLYGVEMVEFFEEEEDRVRENVACAFRTDGFTEKDMEVIAGFKAIVKSYQKMSNLMDTL